MTATGKISFELFEKTFRSEVPNNLEMETKVLRLLREWMFKNNLSSEQTYDTFCKVVKQKCLDRVSLHKACKYLSVGLQAAQVDGLYTMLASEANGELTLNMWLSRVYQD
jgi:hypothetical protein